LGMVGADLGMAITFVNRFGILGPHLDQR